MAKPHGSVRIGPIGLFTLIIILCLVVLSVLSLTTARAELSVTERQAATTTETYQLETAAQTFVAEVDGALLSGGDALADVLAAYGIASAEADAAADAPVEATADGTAGATADAAASTASDTGEAIEDDTLSGAAASDDTVEVVVCPADDPITVSGTFDGSIVSATFSMESGRTLDVALHLNDDGTYRIEQWKTTTQWMNDGPGENLWLG
ncbi:hypothetical protein VJ918_05305 [Adlercreutzia sp. R21]|uniref:hypothetical protein n=1 Tax=Adlercreutzia wanghongyangiae TaxID=3111451 RepID=UPI002DB596F0|nr:hypothetical protein [Adlercreutzia sp. R21]MEC4184223.1 hypothetical protein [Adlercreutzia sp. R21]